MTREEWTAGELLAVAAILDCSTVPGAARLADKAARHAAQIQTDCPCANRKLQEEDLLTAEPTLRYKQPRQ